MKATQLNATKREKAGKGASRACRRVGEVPAVIYGDKQAPVLISLPEKVVVAQMNTKGLWTRQFEITVDGNSYHCLCQDIQKHPVSDKPIHADFLRIAKNAILTLDIPLEFINEEISPAVKFGGVLNIVHRTVEVKCSALNIPDSFQVDLSKVEMGDSVLASSLVLPEGVKLTAEEDFTIATIVAPTEEVEETPAADTTAPAEGTTAPAAGTEATSTQEKKEEK